MIMIVTERRGAIPAFSEAIDEALEAITATLDGIDRIVDAETGLQELHAYILAALWLVDRDPEIEAAARDLHATVARLARRGFLRLARADHWGELNEAVGHFERLLRTARPSRQVGQATRGDR